MAEVHLGSCGLVALPLDLGALQSLHTLDVSANELADLPPALGWLPSLARLACDGNPMRRVRRALVDGPVSEVSILPNLPMCLQSGSWHNSIASWVHFFQSPRTNSSRRTSAPAAAPTPSSQPRRLRVRAVSHLPGLQMSHRPTTVQCGRFGQASLTHGGIHMPPCPFV